MQDKDYVLDWVKKVGDNTSKHIQEQIDNYNDENTLIILDRCIIDHFIYSIMHTIKFAIPLDIFFEIIKTYKLSVQKIDYIFLTSVPDNDFYDVDGIRPQDWSETRNLENYLFQLLLSNNAIKLPYDIDKRIEIIEKTVS